MFKYEWIWEKSRKTGFPNANRQPLRNYEDVLVFYNGQSKYNPQNLIKKEIPKKVNRKKPKNDTVNAGENDGSLCKEYIQEYENYPSQILKISNEGNTIHPTQKPVALFQYLQLTYTNEGDTILDNCAGSFTTAIAADNIRRNWICIEKDPDYCAIGKKRINENRVRLNANLLEKFDLPLLD